MKKMTLWFAGAALLTTTFLPIKSADAATFTRSNLLEFVLNVNASTGEFSTLIAAVVEAELTDALDGPDRLTVFAPTDAAFAALGLDADNVSDLGKDALTDILLYHITPGTRKSGQVLHRSKWMMLNGEYASTLITEEGAFIVDNSDITEDAQLDVPMGIDFVVLNGVVHVIDNVLLPTEMD